MSNRGLIGRRLLGAWEACRRKAGPWVYKSVLRVPGATRVLVYSGGSGRSMNSKGSSSSSVGGGMSELVYSS